MKQILVLIMVSILVFTFGCRVYNSDTLKNTHLGQWQWVQSVGGFAGETRTPESTGYTQKLIFNWSSYKFYRNDTLIAKVDYTIKLMPSPYSQDSLPTIYVENGISKAFELSKNYDTLFLLDNCIDCFAHTYYRIR